MIDRLLRGSRGQPPAPEAVEVTAMLGDSVLGVKHCMDPRGGRLTRATRAIAACGLACLLASAIAFVGAVRTAARDAAAFDRHTRVLRGPAHALRPRRVSALAEGVVVGGLVLGLSALAAAHLRAGRERESPLYRIGTAPGVDQPLEGAPSVRFPLVAPSGDDFVLNCAPGIEGELIVGRVTTPLSELAAAGLARPSSSAPGALEIPIPLAAQIRARVGRVTFLVSSILRPAPQATPAPASAIDRRAVWCVAGSLAAHLGLVYVLDQVDHDDSIIDDDFIIICRFPISDPAGPPEPDGDDCDRGRPHERHCGPSAPPLSRDEEIERAREVALTGGIPARPLLLDDAPWLASEYLLAAPRVPFERVWPEPRRSYLRGVEAGALDKALIKRRIRPHELQIDDCYDIVLFARPSLGGAVSVQLQIGPAGEVQRSIGVGFDAMVARCVAAALERIPFPAPRGGAPSQVTASFQFRPAGRR